ncbi:MAG: hypothetical protein SPJ34_04535 [Candidatus Ornithospirochaeta sp.]|nr:hypothetical protein [Candidatus Ornithospirochaeta sp.]
MKKSIVFLCIACILAAMFVSCSSEPKADETVSVRFLAASSRNLGVTNETFIPLDSAALNWYYHGQKMSDMEFATGQSASMNAGEDSYWTRIADLGTPISFSQGQWKFELKAEKEGKTVYYGKTAGNVLLSREDDSNVIPITVSAQVAGVDGTLEINGVTIVPDNRGAAVKPNRLYIDSVLKADFESDYEDDSIYSIDLPAGTHTVKVVRAGEDDGIVIASEEKSVIVYSGLKTTVTGTVAEKTTTGKFKPVSAVIAGAIPVEVDSGNNAKSTAGVTIEKDDLIVTIPSGAKVTVDGENAINSESKADAKIGFEFVSNTASSEGITLSTSEKALQYDLTLNVNTSETGDLIKVEKNIEKNLVISAVYHDGVKIADSQAGEGGAVREYYSYESSSGKLTLYVFHASPIDVIAQKSLPANAVVVKTVDELKSALDANKEYIALGSNIVLTGSGGSEQVIALNDTTIDLNGYTLNGSIWSGSYLSSADGTRLTLVDSGSNANDKVNGGKIYSKFRFGNGGAMMQANAVTSWQHAVTINSGVYLSNNVAIVCQIQNTDEAEGVIINGGYFGGSDDLIEGVSLPGPVGGCVEAVIGTVTINGGTFKAAQYGSVIIAESGNSYVDTVVNINGGEFSGACMFDFGEDNSSKSIVNVYGGDFTVVNPDGSSEIIASSFAYDNVTHAALVNNENFELNIMGGTFNYNPSAYVAEGYHVVAKGSGKWTVVKD